MAQSAPAPQPSAQDVLGFLNQSIGWYNQLPVEQQLAVDAGDLLFLDNNRQLADQVVRLSFAFANAEAAVLVKEPAGTAGQAQPGSAPARYQSLIDLTAKAEQQVKQSQQELQGLRQQLDTASGRRRRALESAMAEMQSEIELAQTHRDVLRSMLEFVAGTNTGTTGGGLRVQIEELERSIPVLGKTANGSQSGSMQTAPRESAAAALAAQRTQPSGILALISDLLGISRKLHNLDARIQSTQALADASKSLRSPLSTNLRDLLKRGDQVAQQPDSADAALLTRQKTELDAITSAFKQSSETVMPLVKQRILLDLYQRNLTNWRNSVNSQYSAELKSLVLRLVALALILALVIGMSQLWAKAIYRYIQDARRRYQLLLIRRIVLWFLIAIIIAFAFAAELGSLATFAGLITAGVAVALQNVILSVAGYFFLIGKYGVRVGDRVQIASITGRVVDIGLVRLHVMELSSTGSDAQPTGRVVAFSNSVVFQPTGGLFKQIPGTNFVWHEISLTLAPESNYRLVEERLLGVVSAVFAEYREQMETQWRQMERALGPVSVNPLGPQSRLKLTQTGLEVVIRYPLKLDQAANIDDRITREVLDAIDHEPKLRLVGSGIPNIQEVANEAASAAGAASGEAGH